MVEERSWAHCNQWASSVIVFVRETGQEVCSLETVKLKLLLALEETRKGNKINKLSSCWIYDKAHDSLAISL